MVFQNQYAFFGRTQIGPFMSIIQKQIMSLAHFSIHYQSYWEEIDLYLFTIWIILLELSGWSGAVTVAIWPQNQL